MRIDYEKQQSANLLSFFADKEMEHKRNVLDRIIKAMKEKNVVWALSCSAMYYFKGLIDDFNDYDIIVENSSMDRFIEVFIELGGAVNYGQNGKEQYFASKGFCTGEIEGVEFDIISCFTVTTYNTSYCYNIMSSEIEFIREIPISPMEANMLLYGMMIEWQAKRRFKYELAKEYLRYNGIKFRYILETQNLPKFIQEDIKELMK